MQIDKLSYQSTLYNKKILEKERERRALFVLFLKNFSFLLLQIEDGGRPVRVLDERGGAAPAHGQDLKENGK